MDGQVFSKKSKDFLVRVSDEAVVLPWYAEPFDGHVFTFLINWVDKNADKVIPDLLDPAINRIVDAVELEDWDLAASEAGTAANLVIDIPMMDEDVEQKVFVDATLLIVDLVRTWIKNKKSE